MRASLVASRGGDPLGRHSVLPQVLSSAPPGGRSGLQLGPLLRSPSWAVAPTGGWTGRSAQVLRAGQSPNAPALTSAQPCPPVPQASHPPSPTASLPAAHKVGSVFLAPGSCSGGRSPARERGAHCMAGARRDLWHFPHGTLEVAALVRCLAGHPGRGSGGQAHPSTGCRDPRPSSEGCGTALRPHLYVVGWAGHPREPHALPDSQPKAETEEHSAPAVPRGVRGVEAQTRAPNTEPGRQGGGHRGLGSRACPCGATLPRLPVPWAPHGGKRAPGEGDCWLSWVGPAHNGRADDQGQRGAGRPGSQPSFPVETVPERHRLEERERRPPRSPTRSPTPAGLIWPNR